VGMTRLGFQFESRAGKIGGIECAVVRISALGFQFGENQESSSSLLQLEMKKG